MTENTATEATEEQATASEPIENSTMDRRKALKLARPVVAERAGITVAQLARIELAADKVSGRTTADEVAVVNTALNALEAEKAESATPDPS